MIDFGERSETRGKRLRTARLNAGYSLGEAARALGVGVVLLSSIETDRRPCPPEVFRWVRKACQFRPVLLVCGGRDYTDHHTLSRILGALKPSLVVHGGARGADTLAGAWATRTSTQQEVYRAEWDRHGRKAGPIRNSAIIAGAGSRIDLCVAFPGGAGTSDMIQKAAGAGIPIFKVSGSILESSLSFGGVASGDNDNDNDNTTTDKTHGF